MSFVVFVVLGDLFTLPINWDLSEEEKVGCFTFIVAVCILCLFFTVSSVDRQSYIVAFPVHTHLLSIIHDNVSITIILLHVRGAFRKFLAWYFISATDLQTTSCWVSF